MSLFVLIRERKRENQAQVDKVLSLHRQADMFSNVALLAVAALIGVSPLVWVILHFKGG